LGLSRSSRVLVQGITGKAAQLHVRLMQEYGTNVVAGVTPFKGGREVLGVPVYDSVRQACAAHAIDASIVFVPAPFAAEAILEAADNDVPWCVCITEHIPQADMLRVRETLRVTGSRTRLVGPNTPGLIVPGRTKIGIMPGYVYTPGPVAIFSRSGTLTYETASRLSAASIGQSVCVGIGGDPFIGLKYVDFLELVRDDPATGAVLVLGEIGGTAEEELARYVVETQFPKPVLAFIAGRTAPAGKRLGHAGAILEEGSGGIADKLAALRAAGIAVCPDLKSLPGLMARALGL
jgi:succinyl-CoA synthetase alpha subunit